MSKYSYHFLAFALIFCSAFARAQANPQQNLEDQFHVAAVDYEAGRFLEAAAILETLLPKLPRSYEVHELLGLVYGAQSQDEKAVEQLQAAIRLRPDATEGHTNLAAVLVRGHKTAAAAEQFRDALRLAPHDYDTNHNLGEFYIQTGRVADATQLLEEAQRIQPSYDNGYDLALIYLHTNRLDDARRIIQAIALQKNTGELHNLLAQVDEKDGKFIEAANEFEAAAHLDPSEDNLFDWGGELLLHRTYDPAVEVFRNGIQRYPRSPRLQIGLGMALYSRGNYDDAVKALLTAADLKPSDARCYLFLSKAYDSSPSEAQAVIERFHRYSELEPNNGRALYYYAMSLWKGKRVEDSNLDLHTVEALLVKSVALNDKLPESQVQLGNLYADQHQYEKSIPLYQRALALDPGLPDAHYRLGQDYVHTGKKDLAKSEFALYEKLRAQHLAEVDKERAEVQQFVYSEKPSASANP